MSTGRENDTACIAVFVAIEVTNNKATYAEATDVIEEGGPSLSGNEGSVDNLNRAFVNAPSKDIGGHKYRVNHRL